MRRTKAKLETGTTGLCTEGNSIGTSLSKFHGKKTRLGPTVRVKIRRVGFQYFCPRCRIANGRQRLCLSHGVHRATIKECYEIESSKDTYKYTLTYHNILYTIYTYKNTNILIWWYMPPYESNIQIYLSRIYIQWYMPLAFKGRIALQNIHRHAGQIDSVPTYSVHLVGPDNLPRIYITWYMPLALKGRSPSKNIQAQRSDCLRANR